MCKRKILLASAIACYCLLLFLSLLLFSAQAFGQQLSSQGANKPALDECDVVRDVPTDELVVALSFDDGPSPKFTPQILEVLEQKDVAATFFVVGMRVERFPDVAKAIAAKHELGNHSFSHPHWTSPTREQVKEEIRKASDVLYQVTGKRPWLFRPPEGYYFEPVTAVAKELGYLTVMWSWRTDPRDWSNPGVERIVARVVENARPGEIIIMHDCGGNRSQTVQALPLIIDGLRARGYRIVTVGELLKLCDPNLLTRIRRYSTILLSVNAG